MIVLIRIAICDDEIGTCSDIENMILNYAKLQALQIDTEVFYSGETLFKTIENKDKYGLIFLDIQLLQLDGVQVGKQIRERLGNEKISIVYISSKETYAMSLFHIFFYWSFCHIYSPSYILLFPFLLGYVYTV